MIGSYKCTKSLQVTEPEITIERLRNDVSKDGPMNKFLKDNNIEMAAQSATSVLSVLNHAPIRKINVKEKIKVRIAVLL